MCCHCYRRDSQSAIVIPQARLKEICKLDQWLQTAVRERDPQAVQAVCATQWSFCLPLLQHNLRKRIKAPLLRVVQVLEDMQRFPATANLPGYIFLSICVSLECFCCVCVYLKPVLGLPVWPTVTKIEIAYHHFVT